VNAALRNAEALTTEHFAYEAGCILNSTCVAGKEHELTCIDCTRSWLTSPISRFDWIQS